MKWFVLCLILFLGIIPANAKKTEEPAVSTQGIELNQNISKIKQSTAEKNEQKAAKNRSKKYIKHNKELKQYELKKTKEEKELEYLKHRLEIKKSKLETMFPESEKGENK